MGRKSIAEKFYEETAIDQEVGSWLVLYKFNGIKPNAKFWSNLTRVIGLAGGDADMRGVFRTNSKRGVLAVIKIVKHYGGESISFKVEEVTGL